MSFESLSVRRSFSLLQSCLLNYTLDFPMLVESGVAVFDRTSEQFLFVPEHASSFPIRCHRRFWQYTENCTCRLEALSEQEAPRK